jgi:hypothetical protein
MLTLTKPLETLDQDEATRLGELDQLRFQILRRPAPEEPAGVYGKC